MSEQLFQCTTIIGFNAGSDKCLDITHAVADAVANTSTKRIALRDQVWEEAALIAEDSAKDAMPDSEYALACNDLAELLRRKKTDWVNE